MGDVIIKKEKFQPKNWRSANATEIRLMCPQKRARYLAYEEPPKEVQDVVGAARQRVSTRLVELKARAGETNSITEAENIRKNMIIGRQKSAESQNRVRNMKIRRQHLKVLEINMIISCQPSAQSALRLELLLPTTDAKLCARDSLTKPQRKRVEELLEDDVWRTLNRC